MDIRELTTFLTTLDAGSFTGAGARLEVSQPTITHRIKTLEQFLDTVLVERTPGRVQATSTGLSFLPYAREIVRLVEEAQEMIATVNAAPKAVAMASPETLTVHRLLPLIEYLCLRHKEMDFSLHSFEPQEALARLRDGRLDCIFMIGVEQKFADLDSRVLGPEPLVLVTAPTVSEKDLDQERVGGAILTCSDIATDECLELELQMFSRAKGLRRVRKLNSLEAVKRSVANGAGVGLLPEVAVARAITVGKLRKVADFSTASTFSQVAWRRNSPPESFLHTVLAAAEQVVREG